MKEKQIMFDNSWISLALGIRCRAFRKCEVACQFADLAVIMCFPVFY